MKQILIYIALGIGAISCNHAIPITDSSEIHEKTKEYLWDLDITFDYNYIKDFVYDSNTNKYIIRYLDPDIFDSELVDIYVNKKQFDSIKADYYTPVKERSNPYTTIKEYAYGVDTNVVYYRTIVE